MDESGGEPVLTWVIDGVPPDAREAAEAAAAAEGLSVGAWLSRLLHAGHARAVGPDAGEAIDDLRRDVADRLQQSDARILATIEPLMDILAQMAARIESIEADSGAAADAPSEDVPGRS